MEELIEALVKIVEEGWQVLLVVVLAALSIWKGLFGRFFGPRMVVHYTAPRVILAGPSKVPAVATATIFSLPAFWYGLALGFLIGAIIFSIVFLAVYNYQKKKWYRRGYSDGKQKKPPKY